MGTHEPSRQSEALRSAVAETYGEPELEVEAGVHSNGEAFAVVTHTAPAYVKRVEVTCTLSVDQKSSGST